MDALGRGFAGPQKAARQQILADPVSALVMERPPHTLRGGLLHISVDCWMLLSVE